MGFNILYLEDDAGLFVLLRDAIEMEEHTVVHATDGSQALSLIQEEGFDLILVDNHLPTMSGLEFIQRVQMIGNQPPIIMVTGAGNEAIATQAMRIGASDYIVKDSDLSYLKMLPDIIQQTIQQHHLEYKHNTARESRKMEKMRANVLTDFIDTASHEFRTPLTGITTSAHLLSRLSNDPKQHKYIQRIIDNSHDILHLVEDLVLLARLDGQTTLLEAETFSLNTLLQGIIEGQSERFRDEDIHLLSQFIDEPLQIQGQAQYLTIAIEKLLDNALQHTSPKGTVSLHLQCDNKSAIVSVKDTGRAIHADDLDHIFERFYRKNADPSARGFGLGLPIVVRIIDLHQGEIQVESTVGQGTTFTLSLPIYTNKSDL